MFIGLREDLCNNYYELWQEYFKYFNPWHGYPALAAEYAGGPAEESVSSPPLPSSDGEPGLLFREGELTEEGRGGGVGGKKTRKQKKRIHKKSRRKPRRSVSPGRWLRKPKRHSRNKRF